jgi:hypothetical protein
MKSEKKSILILYAEEDDNPEVGYATALKKQILTAVGEASLDLRLWWEFVPGTAFDEKYNFARNADMIILALSADFLFIEDKKKSYWPVVQSLEDRWRQTGQKQIGVLLRKVGYKDCKELDGIRVLPRSGRAVSEEEKKLDGLLAEIAMEVSEMLSSVDRSDEKDGLHLKYACNRTEQLDEFQKWRLKQHPPRFFFLHGTEDQSHHGMANRLTSEVIGQYFKNRDHDVRWTLQTINYPQSREMELSKIKLLAKLRDDFGLNPDLKEPMLKQRFGRLLRESNVTSPFRNKDLVLLHFLIDDFDFERGQAADVIFWANSHFFDRAEFESDAPEVIVLYRSGKS